MMWRPLTPSEGSLARSYRDLRHQPDRYARAHGLRIAPQGTGHGAEPLEPLAGAVLLRTRR